jgi:hypothetical protein
MKIENYLLKKKKINDSHGTHENYWTSNLYKCV